MGNRYFERLPWYLNFTSTWGNKPGFGKYWKRQLHKARRRYWKALHRHGKTHPRTPTHYEAEVNWKGW